MTKSVDAMKKIKAGVTEKEDKKELPLYVCLSECMCVPLGRFMYFRGFALRISCIIRR